MHQFRQEYLVGIDTVQVYYIKVISRIYNILKHVMLGLFYKYSSVNDKATLVRNHIMHVFLKNISEIPL